jgi:hypothetical protein
MFIDNYDEYFGFIDVYIIVKNQCNKYWWLTFVSQ